MLMPMCSVVSTWRPKSCPSAIKYPFLQLFRNIAYQINYTRLQGTACNEVHKNMCQQACAKITCSISFLFVINYLYHSCSHFRTICLSATGNFVLAQLHGYMKLSYNTFSTLRHKPSLFDLMLNATWRLVHVCIRVCAKTRIFLAKLPKYNVEICSTARKHINTHTYKEPNALHMLAQDAYALPCENTKQVTY